MKDKKTCVIYCRQACISENNESIRTQEITLKAIANKRKFDIKGIFKDLGKTTEIKNLIEWINENKVDYLLVTRIDRICRNSYNLSLILNLLVEKKIEKIVTSEKDMDQTSLIPFVFAYLLQENSKKRR